VPTRRRNWKRYLLVLVGPALLVGVLVFLKFSQMAKGEEAERMGPPPESVSSAAVLAQTWEETLPSVGTVTGVKGVDLSTDSPGRVTRIHFDSGDVVKQGQLLVELDASVERAQLGAARSDRDLARVNLQRSRALFAQNVIPRAQLDSDQAALEAAERNIAALEAAIERKMVRAPFAGKLGIREVDLGEYLSAGTRATVLEAPGQVFVDFSLPQADFGRVKAGMPVRVEIEGGGTLEGAVTAVEPALEEMTRSLRLRASVPNEKDRLRPGMFVNVSVVLPTRKDVVIVPVTAVVHAPYGDSVFVVEDKKPGTPGASKTPAGKPIKTARQQFVRIGQARGDFVAVSEGLRAGQVVVSAGAFKLRNGSPIVVDNRLKQEPSLSPRPENR